MDKLVLGGLLFGDRDWCFGRAHDQAGSREGCITKLWPM